MGSPVEMRNPCSLLDMINHHPILYNRLRVQHIIWLPFSSSFQIVLQINIYLDVNCEWWSVDLVTIHFGLMVSLRYDNSLGQRDDAMMQFAAKLLPWPNYNKVKLNFYQASRQLQSRGFGSTFSRCKKRPWYMWPKGWHDNSTIRCSHFSDIGLTFPGRLHIAIGS